MRIVLLFPTPQTTTLQGTKQDLFIAKITAPPPPGMAGSYTWHYVYDGLSRLVSACSQWDAGASACLGESFSYSYDGAGNALSSSRWSGSGVETIWFVYNSANQIACRLVDHFIFQSLSSLAKITGVLRWAAPPPHLSISARPRKPGFAHVQ